MYADASYLNSILVKFSFYNLIHYYQICLLQIKNSGRIENNHQNVTWFCNILQADTTEYRVPLLQMILHGGRNAENRIAAHGCILWFCC